MKLPSLASHLTLLIFAQSAFSTPIAVHSGSLVMNLDAQAFATGVAPGFYAGYGVTMTPGQPHIVLGRYFSLEDMVGRKLIGFGTRPDLNGLRPVSNVGTAAAPVWSVDIRQFRGLYNTAPTETEGLLFNVYDTAPTVLPGANRAPVGTDFVIDSNGVLSTATGTIGFGGGLSFLYSNDAFLSYPGSGRYIALGDFSMNYSAPNPGFSGLVISSGVMGTTPIFETKNVVVSITGSDVTISGDLYATGDLLSFTAMVDTLKLGTFRFTSVPQTARQTWRERHFGSTANSGSAADNADPNNNGAANLLDYALHTLPTTSNPGRSTGLAHVFEGSGKLQASFICARSRPDVTLTVQASDALTGTWTDLARSASGGTFTSIAAGASVTEITTGDTRTVTVTDLFSRTDPAHPARFVRLLVTSP